MPSKEDRDYLRVIAIDPSLKNLGVVCGIIYLETGKVLVEELSTYWCEQYIDPKIKENPLGLSLRTQLVRSVQDAIDVSIEYYQPDFVVTEQPVFKGNPPSFQHQIESICSIRTSVLNAIKNPECSLEQDLIVYYPGTIKRTIDVAGNSGDKDEITVGLLQKMKEGVLEYAHPELHHPELMDEHSNDAVAMLLTKANDLFL